MNNQEYFIWIRNVIENPFDAIDVFLDRIEELDQRKKLQKWREFKIHLDRSSYVLWLYELDETIPHCLVLVSKKKQYVLYRNGRIVITKKVWKHKQIHKPIYRYRLVVWDRKQNKSFEYKDVMYFVRMEEQWALDEFWRDNERRWNEVVRSSEIGLFLNPNLGGPYEAADAIACDYINSEIQKLTQENSTMFIFGYCYPGEEGKSGFRPMGRSNNETKVRDKLTAEVHKKNKEAKVEFKETGGKFRLYVDEKPTGFIYLNTRDIDFID